MTKNTDLAGFDSSLPVANLVATGTISVGSNVIINTSQIFVGNSSVNATINSTAFSGTANNATNLGGVSASNFANVTSPLFTTSISVGNSTVNTSINSSSISVKAIFANGATGTAGQVLTSNATSTFWSTIAAFASGTAMLFVQTTAPTGWTKSTTHNDKALRVVSGTASNGGSVAFSTAFASQTVSGTIGSTTLTSTQMPSHAHSMTGGQVICCPPTGAGWQYNGLLGVWNAAFSSTNAAGGGGSHNHTFTGTAINMAVQYVDVIIATKD